VDLAKITCKQYPLMKVNPDYIALWLSGYYNTKHDNTVDIEQLKETAKTLKRECLYNGQGTMRAMLPYDREPLLVSRFRRSQSLSASIGALGCSASRCDDVWLNPSARLSNVGGHSTDGQ
jgi:hypothetical protein